MLQIVASTLQEDRRPLAEVVFRDLHPELLARAAADEVDQSAWTRKIEEHLQTLAAGAYFGSPRLAADYLRWGSVTPESNPPFQNEVRTVFQSIEEVVKRELPPSLSAVLSEFIASAEDIQHPETAAAQPENQSADLQRRYLAALLSMNRNEALQLALEAVEAGMTVREIYLHVLLPSQRELGRRWQTGRITVGQEHYCTAATQFIMGQLHPFFLSPKTATQRTLVASCVGEELHEVGLRIVADLFEIEGWNTVYLGANVPAGSVAQAIEQHDAKLLLISTTMTRHLFALAELISLVRSHPSCAQVNVMVGGYPFNVDPFLWRRVGADCWADSAATAPEVANAQVARMVTSGPTAGESATAEAKPSEPPDEPPTSDDDLSRLNNELMTAQRQLTKANIELRSLSQSNAELAKALQEADQRKDEFLATLAHELRGPLGPLSHAVSILEMDDVPPDLQTEARQTMRQQVKHLSRLISDLMDVSRIVHGKINLTTSRVELREIVEQATRISRPLMEEKKHQLQVDLGQDGIALEADEVRLTQVVANLLVNAAKYTDEGGEISLKCYLDADQAVVEVRDNGVGMEGDVLPHVFGVFTQEQRSRQCAQGGLGLGLSLVKQLVDLHGGSVRAESEGIGRGSTFIVRLPALEPVKEPATFQEPPPPTVIPRRVLVVDDVTAIARITARLLETLGHETMIAHSGQAALEKYQQYHPEIVILDLTLPDMSGFKVAEQIRAINGDDQTLIVAQTGSADSANRQKAQVAGFDEFLVKPVDCDELEKLAAHPKLSAGNGIA